MARLGLARVVLTLHMLEKLPVLYFMYVNLDVAGRDLSLIYITLQSFYDYTYKVGRI